MEGAFGEDAKARAAHQETLVETEQLLKRISALQIELQRQTETLEELQRECNDRTDTKHSLEATIREINEVLFSNLY